EDAAKYARDPSAAMKLARDSGFRAIVLSAVWEDGSSAEADLPPLRRAVDAAVEQHRRPVLAVYQFSASTPTDPPRRRAFVRYAAALAQALPDVRDLIVGNEPNLNLFWQPQFDALGGDQAALDYESLLAAAYDALKSADPKLDVIGGGLAPHGGDRPSTRPTHSPTQFIRDVGLAYRASGRTEPIMDALSIHVYGDSQHVPPTLRHARTTTIGIADYPKLVALLGEAFGGTAQAGTTLPIVYGEYGVETLIPAEKARLYNGEELTAPVDETTQARYYVDAIRLAARQPNVRMLFLFHVVDETRLEGLQSGTRYADGSPKASEAPVRAALEAASARATTGRKDRR
ncbi:MAG: polysaccharide biosynthesis protein PslG, partial [Gaiellaceae bacterium]|nr:polysaccharide biosynthesis protein PslG [Gaiellaceae bacterium]